MSLLGKKFFLISLVLFISVPFTAEALSLNELDVYVWYFTTPDRTESELTKNLTREFDEKLVQAKCVRKVLDRIDLDRLFASNENERRIMNIDGISEGSRKFISIKANAVIFGDVLDDQESGEYKVRITIQSFTGEKIAQESIRFKRGLKSDAESREKFMQELVKKLCPTLPPKYPRRKTPKHIQPNELIQRDNVENVFKDNGDGTVSDEATGLMWQKSGSDNRIPFEGIKDYVVQVNQIKNAKYSDWRLPTSHELSSLVEPTIQSNGLHINPIFDEKQKSCWISDYCALPIACHIDFGEARIGNNDRYTIGEYVRLVRP